MKIQKKRIILSALIITIITGLGFWFIYHERDSEAEKLFYTAMGNSLSSGNTTTVSTRKLYNGTGTFTTDISFDNNHPQISQKIISKSDDGAISVDKKLIADFQNIYIQSYSAANNDNSKHAELSKDLQTLWGIAPENNPPLRVIQEIYTYIPIGNLKQNDSHKVVKAMKKYGTYTIKNETIKKGSQDGRNITEFDIEYSDYGANQVKVAFNQVTKYVTLPEITKTGPSGKGSLHRVHILIDTDSKKFIKAEPSNGDNVVVYKPFQLAKPDNIPTNTIPYTELQNKITAYLNAH